MYGLSKDGTLRDKSFNWWDTPEEAQENIKRIFKIDIAQESTRGNTRMTTYEEARRRRICSPDRGLQYPISARDLKREIAAALSQFSSPSTFSVEVVAKDNIAVFVDDP